MLNLYKDDTSVQLALQLKLPPAKPSMNGQCCLTEKKSAAILDMYIAEWRLCSKTY